jgi:integrase
MWTTQARCPHTHRIKKQQKVSVNLIVLKSQQSDPVRHNPDRQPGQPRHPSPHSVSIPAAIHIRQGDYIFPGNRRAILSNTSMLMLLRRMGRGDLTAHGFRSSFRDWAAELTDFPGDVVEMALAHAVSGKVEAAYRRGDLYEKRRGLMAAWAAFCAEPKEAIQSNVSTRRQIG